MGYDVVIVGAGIAGCTAATLYGRAGLRVALVEKHRDPATFKALCGHFVLGGTEPMLRRTGLWERLLAAGGVAGGAANWTGAGWTPPVPDAPATISLRRERLDPLLREIAAGTPGVDLLLGQTAIGLLGTGERVDGVRVRDRGGAEHDHRGRLVVAADGHRSPVATLAGVAEDRAPNRRFGMWAYYDGVRRSIDRAQIWRGPDVSMAVPTDGGLTMLVAFPRQARRAEFGGDRAAALERHVRGLPDAPDIDAATRVSKVIGMTDYPCIRRDPTPRPGLMLAGDAAVTGDPAPAVGCGWAFRSAEWLVESTLPALRGEGGEAAAARAYRSRLRFLLRHDDRGRADALVEPPSWIRRVVVRATMVDAELGRRAYLFGMRAIPVSGFINPSTVGRSLWLAARRRLDPPPPPTES